MAYTADDNDTIGKQIGNYRITAELGSGGFAEVYLGQHLIFTDKPPVAIKLLYARLKTKEREQFIQEAQFLHRLQHPHILPVLDAGFQDGIPYIIMEYAAKGSLQDRLDAQAGKPLPLNEAITILHSVGEALAYAHQQNIVHRDLKPDNILFNARGDAFLADFGLATILSSARTLNIGSAGTPAYMAPEMFDGTVSVKSDQYALGCIAYELLTGRKPFDLEGVPIYAAQYQHAKVEPAAPTQYNAQIPSQVSRAILTAMAKDRNHRHVDIAAFLDELWEFPDLFPPPQKKTTAAPQKATAAPSKSYDELLNEGHKLYDLKRFDEALDVYSRAAILRPDSMYARYFKGNALLSLKRYHEAIASYDEAIRLDSKNVYCHYSRANALSDLKRYEEALISYDRALAIDPNYVHAHNNKGNVLYNLKRYSDALATYDRVLRIDPNYVFAHNGRGNALAGLLRYNEALNAYDAAIRLDPKMAFAYNGKGIVLNQLGRTGEAQQAFQKARALGYNG